VLSDLSEDWGKMVGRSTFLISNTTRMTFYGVVLRVGGRHVWLQIQLLLGNTSSR
jgi:hypothetical protein